MVKHLHVSWYPPIIAAAMLPAAPSFARCLEGCTAIHTLFGEAAGDQFGWESNHLGDLNADGVRDFVITAPTNDGGGNNAGRIYVYDGASGLELWRATGPTPFGQLGTMAFRAGDLDGDDVMDVIAGAPGAAAGRAIVYSGADGAVIHTFLGEFNGDNFGVRVVGDGDVTLDGIPDLLVGAHGRDAAGANSGRVYLYDGSDFSLLGTADGESSADLFGSGLTFIGDLDGDGRAEWVVGAKDAGAGGGRAYVYSWDGAAVVLLHTIGTPPGSIDFAYLFADGGFDVNADGVPDFFLGDFPANRAWVFSGAEYSVLHMLTGDGNGQFGIGEMIDDVNSDGRDDLVLAAWLSNAGGTQAGKAFVYSGATGGVLETFTHDVPGATFGFDAAGLGDVDGDGKADYVITAAWDLSQRGVVYVIAGTVGPISDIDGDGAVGVTDLLIVLGAWGPCTPCDGCPADLNYDCAVDVVDLLMILGKWG